MKVVHVITSLVHGGAERLLVNSLQHLTAQFEIEIVYLKDSPVLVGEIPGDVKVTKIDFGLGVFWKLRSYLKESQPDIVHTHLGHADFIGLWASRGLGANRFCTMHNIWFKWNWTDNLIFLGYRILFNSVASDCKVISISKVVKQHVDDTLKVPNKRSILLYNGIPDSKVFQSKKQLRAALGFENDDFVVLFVGRLSVQKSVHTLIEAAHILRNKIPNLKVLVIGSGALEFELKNQVSSVDLQEHVYFLGVTNEPEKYMILADVFVLPSIFEGLGLVILEAFRSQLAVISTNIEGPKELIKEKHSGLLFTPGDSIDLAKNIEELYRDPLYRRSLAENAKVRFKERFRIENYTNSLVEIYKNTKR